MMAVVCELEAELDITLDKLDEINEKIGGCHHEDEYHADLLGQKNKLSYQKAHLMEELYACKENICKLECDMKDAAEMQAMEMKKAQQAEALKLMELEKIYEEAEKLKAMQEAAYEVAAKNKAVEMKQQAMEAEMKAVQMEMMLKNEMVMKELQMKQQAMKMKQQQMQQH